jgi:hypothetical protein
MVRFLTVAAIFAAIFIVCEICARALYKESYLTGLFKDDPVFHHLPPPYYKGMMQSPGDFDLRFTTNNRGMRGPGDYAYGKDPGVFRVAVMGDSFAFGVGVEAEQTASSELERLLNAGHPTAGRRYQVYNFGVNSFSPLLEYIYLKKEVIRYRPDIVVLMLDLCDIQDDYLYGPHIVRGASGDIEGCDPFRRNGAPDPGAAAIRASRLLFILDQKLFQSFRKMAKLGFGKYIYNKAKGVRNKTEILTNKKIDNIEFDRFLMVRDGKDRDVVLRHWNRTAKYLSMIKRYLDGRSVPLVVVVYPYGHQVGERQWEKGRRYWAFEPGRVYDPAAAFAMIDEFARNEKIGLVNVYPAMKEMKDQKLYFNSDGHMTALGQRIMAEAVYGSPVFRDALGKR